MMKRSLGLALSLLLIFSFAACGGSPTQTPIHTEGGQSQTPASTQADKPDAQGTADAPAVAIEEAVLLDQDGLVITAKELVDDPVWGMGVKVLIENNSEKSLGVQCNSLIVNNYMISDLFSSSVAAGKKSNDTIYLSSSGLEAAGITTISDVIISFHVFDGSNYSTLFDTDEIEIRTSAYGTVQQPAMDDGKELFNQDGIRIIGRYVEEDSFWGAGVLLFIENNHGGNILVQCDNLSVNGFMVTPLFSCAVNNGRMALSDITILSSDLKENNIEAVEDIELVFRIIDADTYQAIVETDPIAFSTR